MHDPSRINQELIEENTALKQKIKELEESESDRKRMESALRESAEKALQESEKRFRTLIDHAAVGIAEVEAGTGRFLAANRMLCEMLGRTEEEVLATTFMAITHPEDLDLHPILSKRMYGGEIGHYGLEKRYLRKDGRVIWVHITVSRLWQSGETPGSSITVVHDITERKQAEETLRESEAKYRTIIEDIEDGYYEADINGNFTFFNEPVCKMLGHASDELLGMNNRQYADEENTRKVYQAYNQVYLTGQSIKNFEWQVIRKDGVRRDVEVSISLIRNEKGGPTGFRGIVRDITDRKLAEEALQGQLQFLQQLLDAIPVPIFYKDRQGVFRGCNMAYEKFVGTTKEQVVGTTVFGFLPKDIANIYHQADRALFTQPGVQVYETSFPHADGNMHDIIFNKATYVGRDGGVVGLVGVILDITERKLAQEEINYTLSLLNATLESTADGLLVVDREGKILKLNQKFIELWRIPASILETRDDSKALAFVMDQIKDPKGFLSKVVALYSKPTEESFDIIEFKDERVFERYSQPQRVGDAIVGRVWSFRDITERRRAEEENRNLQERLQRSEKMEVLGQLAGGVAHDLNNVLGILSGYSELLLEEIPEGSRSRGHVEKILQSTEKGAAIIQDLLTLARRGVSASDVINLNSVVLDFLKTPVFESMKDYHPRVTFRTECDKNLLNIKGSPIHLEKTLMNLVSNAAESISGKGEVTIQTENRYLDRPVQGYDEVKQGDYVVLTVSDTGMGISSEDREKIFEPFYTKKIMGRSGTGLGLAIVWGTVKDHNGYIDLQTGVEQGTTFTLYFPVTREELTAQQQKVPIERYMANGESVLVVDDIAEQREIATTLLARLGYQVHAVSGGEEAVGYLKENTADILVLDMIMAPGIDGLETYQRVLEMNPTQKAILVSGFSETDRVKEAQKLGAGAYVKKPYVIEKIGVALRDELVRK